MPKKKAKDKKKKDEPKKATVKRNGNAAGKAAPAGLMPRRQRGPLGSRIGMMIGGNIT